MSGLEVGRGKWSQAGVPHRGWTCDDIEDLGSPSAICEMCETQEIRYVHHMSHPAYPEALACGCVCAGHMEEDLEEARGRERRMRNAARRRSKWPDRQAWRRSRAGNPTIMADGFRVTVFERPGYWSASVTPIGGEPIYSKRQYPSMRAAQLAAFDKMTQLGR